MPVPAHPIATPVEKREERFDSFAFRTIEKDGRILPYRLHQPARQEPGVRYPLVLFLHGAGERGADNRGQFSRFTSTVRFWEQLPCFVLAPQCPLPTGDDDAESVWVQTSFRAPSHIMRESPSWPLRLVMEMLDRTLAEHPVDLDRVYVTGLSMGGFASWELLQREPGKFAAAMPVCGGADLAFAPKLAGMPAWLFHSDDDHIVPVCRSRDMIAALKAAGGSPRYTEYTGFNHDAWIPAYADNEAWTWLFSQRRALTDQR